MDYVRRVVWGMLYAEDACIVSRSLQGLAKMMEVIVEVCQAFALLVPAKKAETMCMTETGAILHLPRGRLTETPHTSVEIACVWSVTVFAIALKREEGKVSE